MAVTIPFWKQLLTKGQSTSCCPHLSSGRTWSIDVSNAHEASDWDTHPNRSPPSIYRFVAPKEVEEALPDSLPGVLAHGLRVELALPANANTEAQTVREPVSQSHSDKAT